MRASEAVVWNSHSDSVFVSPLSRACSLVSGELSVMPIYSKINIFEQVKKLLWPHLTGVEDKLGSLCEALGHKH